MKTSSDNCSLFYVVHTASKRDTHSKQIVIKQLRHADDHVKGNRLQYVHHLHVFTYNKTNKYRYFRVLQTEFEPDPQLACSTAKQQMTHKGALPGAI